MATCDELHSQFMKAMIRLALLFPFLLAAGTLFLSGAFLQSDEYQIVSIDAGSWLVTARSDGGDTLAFRMPPSVFQGRCFHANLTGVREGGQFSIVGPPGDRFDRLQAETARGNSAAGKGGAPSQRSRRPNTRGMLNYCVTEVDSAGRTMTAQARSGEKIRFKIDVASFRGYRFQVPNAAELAAGGRFSLTAPNEVPVRCCTLVERLP